MADFYQNKIFFALSKEIDNQYVSILNRFCSSWEANVYIMTSHDNKKYIEISGSSYDNILENNQSVDILREISKYSEGQKINYAFTHDIQNHSEVNSVELDFEKNTQKNYKEEIDTDFGTDYSKTKYGKNIEKINIAETDGLLFDREFRKKYYNDKNGKKFLDSLEYQYKEYNSVNSVGVTELSHFEGDKIIDMIYNADNKEIYHVNENILTPLSSEELSNISLSMLSEEDKNIVTSKRKYYDDYSKLNYHVRALEEDKAWLEHVVFHKDHYNTEEEKLKNIEDIKSAKEIVNKEILNIENLTESLLLNNDFKESRSKSIDLDKNHLQLADFERSSVLNIDILVKVDKSISNKENLDNLMDFNRYYLEINVKTDYNKNEYYHIKGSTRENIFENKHIIKQLGKLAANNVITYKVSDNFNIINSGDIFNVAPFFGNKKKVEQVEVNINQNVFKDKIHFNERYNSINFDKTENLMENKEYYKLFEENIQTEIEELETNLETVQDNIESDFYDNLSDEEAKELGFHKTLEDTPGSKFEIGNDINEKLKIVQSELQPEYPFQTLFTELDQQNIDYKIIIDENTELITSIQYFENDIEITEIPEVLELNSILAQSDYLQEIKYPGTPIDLLPSHSYTEIEAAAEVRSIYTEERLKEVYVDKYLHSKEFKDVIKDTYLSTEDILQLKSEGTLSIENLNINGVSVDGKLGIYLNDTNVVQHAISVDDYRLNSMLDPLLNTEHVVRNNRDNTMAVLDRDNILSREISDFELNLPDAINSSIISEKNKFDIIKNDYAIIPINVNNNLYNIKIRKDENQIHINFTDKILLTDKQREVLNYKPSIIERLTKRSKPKLVKLVLKSYGLDITKDNINKVKETIKKSLGNKDSILNIQDMYFKEFTATIQTLENKVFSEKRLSVDMSNINERQSNIIKTDLKSIKVEKLNIEDKIKLLNQQINTKFITKEIEKKKGFSM